jgi:hypothetical protein
MITQIPTWSQIRPTTKNLQVTVQTGVIDFVNGSGFKMGGFNGGRFDANNSVSVIGGVASLELNYGCQLASSASLGWVPAANPQVAPDLTLVRDAANVLAQRRGTVAQTRRLYATFTDSSNYSRLSTIAGTDRYTIYSEAAGTGLPLRALEMSFNTLAAAYPTTANVTSGTFGVWKNTSTGIVRLYVNDGGTMKFVALS